MNGKDLLARGLVVLMAVGIVVLAATICKAYEVMLVGVAGSLFGWVLPWFQVKGNGKNEVVK